MKVLLPNNEKVILPGSITYEERLKLVKDILYKHEAYFIETWDTRKTKTCLDMLGYYLSRASDFKDEEYPTASTRESAVLSGKRKSKHYVNFSDLNNKQQYVLGLKETSDDSEVEN